MSRIGKKPIEIPSGTEVRIEGKTVLIKGPKGELKKEFRPEVSIELVDGMLKVSLLKETLITKALWGLTRALLANMVKGVTEGYEKKLQLEGIGYRAQIEGDSLIMQLGFSHPVKIIKPESLSFTVEKNIITIQGADKELVGQYAAKIRKVKPPEPYKGTGVRYVGEIVKKKPGKKVVTVGS